VVAFNVPQTAHEVVRVQRDEVPYFYDQLHQHPEIQVMLIEKGEGTLVAGDYVGRFQPGDVYVLGGGQPHVFRCDPSYYKERLLACSTSLYFNERYFGKELWSANELAAVRELADHSRHGLQVPEGLAPEAARVIVEIARQEGLSRMVGFFRLLELLTMPGAALRKLSLQPGRLVETEEDRMNRILEFTFRESYRKIYLDEVAQLAHLSVEAFCRYFKLHTRKTYINFLHEVRISQACQSLLHSDLSVEQICYQAGFSNVSHFNRVFKRITGKTPLRYRAQAWGQTEPKEGR
jgi:AraC-like DNA-binding protein